MIAAGIYHTLEVSRFTDFGAYLKDKEGDEVLLPNRYVSPELQTGDMLNVFVYHDSENRLTATTDKPLGIVGDIVYLNVVSNTKIGAFVKWGIMKDLLVPLSQQSDRLFEGKSYLFLIYRDEMTGRVAATQRYSRFLSNQELTVAVKDEVDILVERQTELGYAVIVNNKHIGLIHFSDIFQELKAGDCLKGFVKAILPENKLDIIPGKPGYKKTEDAAGAILRLLQENDGYLPYHDKSDAEDIADFFGMSKKTFKMTIGSLYKSRKIELFPNGIRLVEDAE